MEERKNKTCLERIAELNEEYKRYAPHFLHDEVAIHLIGCRDNKIVDHPNRIMLLKDGMETIDLFEWVEGIRYSHYIIPCNGNYYAHIQYTKRKNKKKKK